MLAAASRRLVQQGDAAGRQGDLNAATSAYDKAVAYDQERGAEHTEARARLRAVHLEWTEAQAQIDHARNLINRGPNPALLEEAIGSLRPLLRLTPTFNNVPVLLEDAIRKRVSLHVKVIRQALARGAAMEARQELARAKDWGSQDAAVVEDLRRAEDEVAAQEDAQQGASYLKEGRLAEAAAHLGRALQRDPHNPVARSKLPEAQRRHGRQVQEGVRSLLRARHYSAAVDRCREGVAAAPYLQAACEGVLQPAERALAKRLSESAERARRSSLPGAVWAYERLVELLPAAFGLPDRQPDRKLPDLGPLLDYDIEVVADPQSTPELAAQVLGPLSQRLAVELAPRRVYVVIGSAPGSQRPQLVFALTSLRMEHPPPVPEERVQAYIRGYDYPENPKWAQKRKECIELTLKYRAFEPRVAQAGAIGAELTRRRQEVEARKSAIGATQERERWT